MNATAPSDALKPCPFCGCEPSKLTVNTVECPNVKCAIGYKRLLVTEWNRRLPSTDASAMRNALEFYRDEWKFKTTPFGLEWSPNDTLLDDCGYIAKKALSQQPESNEE